jgi:hypothetical protein
MEFRKVLDLFSFETGGAYRVVGLKEKGIQTLQKLSANLDVAVVRPFLRQRYSNALVGVLDETD